MVYRISDNVTAVLKLNRSSTLNVFKSISNSIVGRLKRGDTELFALAVPTQVIVSCSTVLGLEQAYYLSMTT